MKNPPTGPDLLAANVGTFWRALDRMREGNSRPLYVSPNTYAMAMRGPSEYWVGTYTRYTVLADIIEDLEVHLHLRPGALHGPFREAVRQAADNADPIQRRA